MSATKPTIEQDGKTYRWIMNTFREASVTRDSNGTVAMTVDMRCSGDVTMVKENCLLGRPHNTSDIDGQGYSPVMGIYQLTS